MANLNKKSRLRSSFCIWSISVLALVCGYDFAHAENDYAPQQQPAALAHTKTSTVKEIDPELTGSNVTIASVCRSLTYIDGQPQNDYSLNTAHNCFKNSNVNFTTGPDSETKTSQHATAISAILVGRDPNAFHQEIGHFTYQGIIPDAQMDIYEFWRFVSSYVFTNKELNADILTMSAGTMFEDWWTRGIEHMAERDGLIVVAGAGNGTSVFDPVLYPAAGANVIAVGVVDSVKTSNLSDSLANFTLPRPEHSSAGPTSDKRCKPDIVAPGNCLVPDANGIAGYQVTGNFSSFATPIVSGSIGLLVQKAKEDPSLNLAVSPAGGNCVIKAILINSAEKLPYWHKGLLTPNDDHEAVLDYVQGAGLLNTEAAFTQLIAGRNDIGNVPKTGWDNNEIKKTKDSENTYKIKIPQTKNDFITATLTWNRHYENQYPFKVLLKADTDLRLELWGVDKSDPATSYLLDYSDSVNDNLEHIYYPADPNYSDYELVVKLSDNSITNANTAERYALAWSVSDNQIKDSILWYDLNGDAKVNNLDINFLLNRLDQAAKPEDFYLPGDINTDGIIDIRDLTILINHLGSN